MMSGTVYAEHDRNRNTSYHPQTVISHPHGSVCHWFSLAGEVEV